MGLGRIDWAVPKVSGLGNCWAEDPSEMVEREEGDVMMDGMVMILPRLVSGSEAVLSDLVVTLLTVLGPGSLGEMSRLSMPLHTVIGDVSVKLFKAELTMAAMINFLGVLRSLGASSFSSE